MSINIKDKLVTLESLGAVYNAEVADREAADEAIGARIDNIVAPDGDPSLTEISDARTGAGGTVHTTLKNRLDSEYEALDNKIDNVTITTDSTLDTTSTNPIQNAPVAEAIEQINTSLGESLNLVTSKNRLDTSKITTGKYMAKNGNTVTLANSAYSDRIPVNENDIVRFYNNIAAANMSYLTAFNGDVAVGASGATSVSSYTVPNGITHIVISYNTSQITNPFLAINYEPTEYEPYFNPYYVNTDKSTQNKFNVESENLFDVATYTDGKYVAVINGNTVTEASMCCTDFIPVVPGDVLTFGNGMPGAVGSARFICAYNIAKTVLSTAGSSESVTSYTVPNNVYFVRISFSKTAYAKGFFPWISKTGTIKYMPYYSGTVKELARKNYSEISNILNWPLTSFPAYIRNQLSYKPLGTLTKGYVLLTTDDGQAPLATYTLPMLISKGVPVTMGVMAESEILNNETYAAVFVDAVENHGCSVAAHGAQAYTQYSEYQLNKFFDAQDALLDQFGLTIDGAICPTHAINETVKAVAGGRYGVVRTAASNGVPSYGGNNYLAGPRSNLYALPSESIIGYDLNYHKAAMDLANENHWIRVLYWHDDDLTEQYKTLLEGTIDYALSIGLEFITFKDLANNLII